MGETVCAKVVGAPIGSPVQRRFVWAANSGNTVRTANILTPVQTDLYTLPSTPTSTINGLTIDNRGKWRVNINDTSEGAVRASAFFIVRDPAKPTVNLSVNQTIAVADAEVNAGANIASTLYVNNPGPDNAQNAQLSVSIPANTTFVSATQDSGPAFNCATPPAGSTLNCTNSSLATGAQAVFTVVYKVDQNTPVNTVIVNTSSVSSSTTELNTSDNSSSIRSVVRGVEQTEVECAYTCPGNITQPNDPGQAGAVVNYSPVGSSDASCTATCSRLSGSFFPIGTTTVTCGDDTASCTFDVTVQDTRAVRITLNGASTLEVECHDAFTDPGATAVDPSGNPLEVTTSGSVDANTPNAYTLTYTATDGTTTATETRTVNVVDTQVPTITLNGDDEVTIECHGSFTDPGATAEDTCAGTLPVTASGTVDANTPGDYTITYKATDGTNPAVAFRTVHVADNAAPVPDAASLPDVTGQCTATITAAPTATDACAGSITGTTNDPLTYNTSGTYTVTWTYDDGNGHTSTQTQKVIVADETEPVITLNGSATMTVECHTSFTDPGATAVDGCGGSLTVTASGNVDVNTPDTYTITYTATHGSQTATKTRTVTVIDTTAPVPNAASLPDVTGECSAAITTVPTATDSCGGTVNGTTNDPLSYTTQGTHVVTWKFTDAHGNTSTQLQKVIITDVTPPVISCPANVVVYLPLHSAATSMAVNYPAPTATDNCAGNVPVVSTPASGSVFNVGTTIVNSTATDASGNHSSCSFTVTVQYVFTGFFQPIANLPTLNSVNAGRAIPIKFSLSGNKGLNIFATGYPASGVIACNSNDPAVEVTETTSAGSSSLSYDSGSEQYNYVWKTDSAWAGTCRQLVVQLNDGTFHRANFKFK